MNQIQEIIKKEEQRIREQLLMIPSENYVSKAVLQALGSVVINKYSEGQVGKRYYQGNKNIDEIEQLAKDRALELFGLDPNEWGVNVQAVTGSIANLAVYSAMLEIGDPILSMFLYDGGHLSHGWQLPDGKKISFTSKIFKPNYYYVDLETEVFDYDKVEQRAHEVKPKIIISGGTAYPRDLDHSRLKEIAQSVGAYYMADIAHEAGLVASGLLNSPFESADVVTMTTRKTLRGPIGTIILSRKQFSEEIDRAVMPGLQGGPMNNNIAAIAVALREAMTDDFKEYSRNTILNAKTLAEELVKLDIRVVSGGTDKHLLLIDLKENRFSGKEVAIALEKANIITNKNTIPGETSTPWNPSGIRLGTPAITSRGIKVENMPQIASWISQIIKSVEDESQLMQIADEVRSFATDFPVPGVDD
ncbi:serine hydroxymethyltransferase [Candidatus Nomurabacteria bacterium]|nr:serine hydroxymethyltransferase [Candidatus Nomurabacteria bacterium]